MSQKKNFEQFTNQYALSKTLRFELKPVGETLDNMRAHLQYDKNLQTFLKDQDIEDAYQTLKPVLDKIHEDFITQSLESDQAKKIDFLEYLEAYKEKKEDKGEKKLREEIGKLYKYGGEKTKEQYQNGWKWNKNTSSVDKKYPLEWKVGGKIKEGATIMKSPDILYAAAAKAANINEELTMKHLQSLDGFFTYFEGFNQNRENYYATDEKATAVATRIVHENLPKFCDNLLQFQYVIKKKKSKEIGKMEEEKISKKEEYKNAYQYLKDQNKVTQIKDAESGKMIELSPISEEIFDIAYFTNCLSQKGIEKYNRIIGHYNSLINLYNQAKRREEGHLSKNQKTFKDLPKFKTLYKQIGCGEKKALFFALTHNTKAEAKENKENYREPYSVEHILEHAKDAGGKYFQKQKSNTEPEANKEIETIPDFLDYILEKESYEGVYWSKMAFNTISNRYFANWYDLKDRLKDAKVFQKSAQEGEDVKIPEVIELSDLFEVLDTTENWQTSFFKESLSKTEGVQEESEKNKREKRKKIIDTSQNPSEALLKMIFDDMRENMQSFLKTTDSILEIHEYQEEENKKKIKAWMDYAKYTMQMLKYFQVRENKIKKGNTPLDTDISNTLKCFFSEAKLDDETKVDWFTWYDALRNYLTKKPQDDAKENKLKLNFLNSTLAGGWDVNKETDNTCVILKDAGDKKYLSVIKKSENTLFQKNWIEGRGKNKTVIANPLYEISHSEYWEKMEYDFWSDVSKMIPKCSTQLKAVIKHFKDSDESFVFPSGHKVTSGEKFVEECRITKKQFELNNLVYKENDGVVVSAMRYDLSKTEEKKYVKGFQKGYWTLLVKSNNPGITKDEITKKWRSFVKNGPQTQEDRNYKEQLSQWIDFCKYFLSKYPKTILFDYNFKETSEYESVDKFNLDVDICSYKLKIDTRINKDLLDAYVKEGKVYLFEIKNQDSNTGKKEGHKENLHTMYWHAIFNQFKNRPKLNGEAALFYRKPLQESQLKKKVHKGKEIIENYRFSKEKFLFHVPITLNFCLNNENINNQVHETFSQKEDIYFLGLDRGEKHLVYYSLVDKNGKIIKQDTLNLPFTDKEGNPRNIKKEKQVFNREKKEWEKKIVDCWDYNDLLDVVASNRDEARKNWQTIGNIKNLKEGYISQVVHEIAKIVQEKPTFIVLEDLNTGFKRGRQKIERQVYQKFELALAKKLNFLVNKDAHNGEIGSVTDAIQFTPPVQNYGDIENRKQVGIMLYTRANYTSQTDPLTGWRKTIYLKKGSEESIRDQIAEKFNDIGFENGHYFFEYQYGEVVDQKTGEVKPVKWRLWSGHNGKKLLRYKGKRSDKNMWTVEEMRIEEILDALFADFGRKERGYLNDLLSGEKKLQKIDEKHTAWESLRFVIDSIQQIRNSGDTSKNQDDNFLLSPVRNEKGEHFDSRKYEKTENAEYPKDADANGAYNIARKGIIMNAHIQEWIRNGKKKFKEGSNLDLFISDKEWDLWLKNKEEWGKMLPIFSSKKEMKQLREKSRK